MTISVLFKNVIQRFNEHDSIDSLKHVYLDNELATKLLDNLGQYCRLTEGDSRSDKYADQKPTAENLNIGIKRFNCIGTISRNLKIITISRRLIVH